MRIRLLCALLIGLVPLVVLPAASPSNAASSCPSGQYVQQSYKWAGTVVATLCTNGSLTGKATLQSQGRFRGTPKKMALTVCKLAASGPYDCKTDSGTYSYYAGPVQQPGGCQHFHSVMYDGNGTRIVNGTWNLCD